MNKKQVGALLKVMSKDNMRPVICSGYVDRYNERVVLVTTDGYKLSAIYMDGADELVGKLIRRSAFEKWYKLATGKSRLNGEELVSLSADDYAQNNGYMSGDYPKWQGLVPTGITQAQSEMSFNADYFKIIQEVDGAESVKVELYGKLSPMVIKTDNGVHLVMPMKG